MKLSCALALLYVVVELQSPKKARSLIMVLLHHRSNGSLKKNLLFTRRSLLGLLGRRVPSGHLVLTVLRAPSVFSLKAYAILSAPTVPTARGSQFQYITPTVLRQAQVQLLVTSRQVDYHARPLRSLPLPYIPARLRSLFSCSRSLLSQGLVQQSEAMVQRMRQEDQIQHQVLAGRLDGWVHQAVEELVGD